MTSVPTDRTDPTDPVGDRLTMRVLSALLREDVIGLRSRGRIEQRPDGCWLLLDERDRALALPVAPDGFQAEHRARLPVVELTSPGHRVRLTDTDAILAEMAAWADPRDRAGFVDYARECRDSLATVRLHEQTRTEVDALLIARHGPDPRRWTGLRHNLAFDALAARIDHPVYPTARARAGFDEAQLRAHAPEFAPVVRLRWLTLPAEALTLSPGAEAAFPVRDGQVLLPVHPLTPARELQAAFTRIGLAGNADLRDGSEARFVPTLSMRTLARLDEPTEHLKVPLTTATLGLRNRRTIQPGTLLDGVAGQRLVAAVLDRTPRLRDRLLLADETCFVHAGHELLAALVRRYPTGLEDSLVVPLAALLAPAPDGRLVLEHTADVTSGGDPFELLRALWDLLLDLQVTLFTHGMALESHQQNLSLVAAPGRPLRLLLKDNDGPRVLRGAGARLGLPDLAFDDARVWVGTTDRLTEMIATITIHLCAGSYAFGLARAGLADRAQLLDILRDCLERALDRPGTTALRERLLESPQLPIKAMVTAGSLLTKERSGAADVNKHYTSGPNYLRPTSVRTT